MTKQLEATQSTGGRFQEWDQPPSHSTEGDKIMTLQQLNTSTASAQTPIPCLRTDAAFAHKGAKAAVFKPRFGQAHQQYLCAV